MDEAGQAGTDQAAAARAQAELLASLRVARANLDRGASAPLLGRGPVRAAAPVSAALTGDTVESSQVGVAVAEHGRGPASRIVEGQIVDADVIEDYSVPAYVPLVSDGRGSDPAWNGPSFDPAGGDPLTDPLTTSELVAAPLSDGMPVYRPDPPTTADDLRLRPEDFASDATPADSPWNPPAPPGSAWTGGGVPPRPAPDPTGAAVGALASATPWDAGHAFASKPDPGALTAPRRNGTDLPGSRVVPTQRVGEEPRTHPNTRIDLRRDQRPDLPPTNVASVGTDRPTFADRPGDPARPAFGGGDRAGDASRPAAGDAARSAFGGGDRAGEASRPAAERAAFGGADRRGDEPSSVAADRGAVTDRVGLLDRTGPAVRSTGLDQPAGMERPTVANPGASVGAGRLPGGSPDHPVAPDGGAASGQPDHPDQPVATDRPTVPGLDQRTRIGSGVSAQDRATGSDRPTVPGLDTRMGPDAAAQDRATGPGLDQRMRIGSGVSAQGRATGSDRPNATDQDDRVGMAPVGPGQDRYAGVDRSTISHPDRPGGLDRPHLPGQDRPAGHDRPHMPGQDRPAGLDRPHMPSQDRPGGLDRPHLPGQDRPAGLDGSHLPGPGRPAGPDRPTSPDQDHRTGFVPTQDRPTATDHPVATDRQTTERPNTDRPAATARPAGPGQDHPTGNPGPDRPAADHAAATDRPATDRQTADRPTAADRPTVADRPSGAARPTATEGAGRPSGAARSTATEGAGRPSGTAHPTAADGADRPSGAAGPATADRPGTPDPTTPGLPRTEFAATHPDQAGTNGWTTHHPRAGGNDDLRGRDPFDNRRDVAGYPRDHGGVFDGSRGDSAPGGDGGPSDSDDSGKRPWAPTDGPRPARPVLPHRVPAPPDVPDVYDGYDDLDDETADDGPQADPGSRHPGGPELSRIASGLREVDRRSVPEELDVDAVLAAVRRVNGVRGAELRPNPGGVHTLRLDLADGADAGWVSRQVARVLKERMGLAAEPRKRNPLAPVPTSSGGHAKPRPAPDAARPDPVRPPAVPPTSIPMQPTVPGPSASPDDVPTSNQPTVPIPRLAADPRLSRGGRPTSLADLAPPAGNRPTRADQLESSSAARAVRGRELAASRVELEQVHVATVGTEATVEVRLRSGGVPAIGTATGPAVDAYLLRLAAQATAEAVDAMADANGRPNQVRCFIDHAGVVPFGGCVVAVVVVLLSGEGWVEQVVGSALVAGDPRHAIARATLDAVNRRLEWLLT